MANEYLKRTPTSTGNKKSFTWAGWVKLNANNVTWLFTSTPVKDNVTLLYINTNGLIHFFDRQGSDPTTEQIRWNPQFRDLSSWKHILINADTTQGEASERVKCYVNGVMLERDETGSLLNNSVNVNTPAQDQEFWRLNGSGYVHYFGARLDNSLETPNANQFTDIFYVDGQQLGPEVFGFYKDGNGYISAGSTQSTDFRNGQWVPRTPREIKNLINDNGGFGVNGFYLPMNDSSNFGADFHTTPNSIIKLGEDLPQPKVSIASTAQAGLAYTDVLRSDPYAANLVLAIPFVNSGLCTNGTNSGINTGFGDYSHIINSSQTAKGVQVITYNGTTPTIVSAGSSSTNYYGSACYIDGNGSAHAGGHIRVVDDTIFDNLNLRTANWTIEGWFNPASRSSGGSNLFNLGDATDYYQIQLILDPSGDPWHLWSYTGSAWNVNDAGTTARPPLNQWSHIAFEKVGTGTTSHITTYVNGVAAKVTAVPQDINYSSNPRLILGGHYISGESSGGDTYYYDGLISDVRMYNVAKYKGGFDVPKPYTPVGIATWRAVSDTCKNNFATLNPISGNGSGSQFTFTDGNLTATTTTSNKSVTTNVGMSTGKWYWEYSPTQIQLFHDIGISSITDPPNGFDDGTLNASWRTSTGQIRQGNTNIQATGMSAIVGDIVQVAFNADTRRMWVGVNGSYYNSGDPAAGTNFTYGSNLIADTYYFASSMHSGGSGTMSGVANFGQNPTFSGNKTAGTFTDSNGKGLFKYQPPSGFLALCEDNLPTPAIKNPGEHFKTVLWTGDGNSGRSITGVGFQPDLVWVKERTSTSGHHLYDSVRGPLKYLVSSGTNAENEVSTHLSSFDSDGWSMGSSGGINELSQNYVAWCWKAGGAAVSNPDGTIASQVSANQTAGFSIVSYTGDGNSGATVGHNLGKSPAMIIVKRRETTASWPVWHKSAAEGHNGNKPYAYLDLTNAFNVSSPADVFSTNANAHTSDVLYLGPNSLVNNDTDKYIAYCWAEIEGFSKFGSYVGNGNADGPFVYCGFKPAWIIFKRVETTGSWVIKDSSRISTNPNNYDLFANATDVESDIFDCDFLSNGFKIRDTTANTSGGIYIFAAFAESPFQTANAK